MSSLNARLEVWRGEIPAVFNLAPEEVASLERPIPFHMCLPRQSLLPFVTQPVRQHFLPFAPPLVGDSEMWFEFEGAPLHWQLPIGVLFDLLAGAEAAESELPWRCTVHFQAFPSGTLLRSSPKEAEQLLLNALKEACHLRCGSALPVMSLPPEAQAELTAALSSSGGSDARAHQDFASGRAYEAFAKVDEKLRRGMANQLGGGGGGGGDDGGGGGGGGGGGAAEAARALPVRICVGQTRWRQLALAPQLPCGRPCRLADALAAALPDDFGEAAAAADGADGGGPSGGAALESAPAPAGAEVDRLTLTLTLTLALTVSVTVTVTVTVTLALALALTRWTGASSCRACTWLCTRRSRGSSRRAATPTAFCTCAARSGQGPDVLTDLLLE